MRLVSMVLLVLASGCGSPSGQGTPPGAGQAPAESSLYPVDDAQVVATVSGVPVTVKEFQLAAARRVPANGDSLSGEERAEVLEELVQDKLSRMLAEIRAIFDEHGVCWSPYRTIRTVVEKDPDCSPANPMFEMVDQPGIGTYLMPGSPLDFGLVERLHPVRAPLLGEHTDEVLADVLGMSAAEIGKLHDEGIVAGPDENRA